uniref:C2H2-type domain-containing protein n=1 Tax=Anopheles melas TaxID=34690 RepID=A0A182TD29_9DIPT
MEVDDTNESKRKIPAYYYLQPSKNGDEEAEEELYDSNGTHITSDYLNDVVAETMSDRYTVVQDSPSDKGLHYKCNECEKLLPNTGHLIAHMVVHTGENPYVCSLCQRSFANSTRLKLHLKVHCIKKLHPGLTVTRITKTVPATPCIPSTNMEVDVDQTSPAVKVATFHCIECEEILPKDTLYRHMKQHLHDKNIFAQKPHQCSRCGDAFAKASKLESHQESCQASPIKVSSEVDLVPINKQEPCSSLKKQIESNPILSGLLLREQKEPPISVTTIELKQAEEQPRVKVEEESSKTDELHNLLKSELDQLEEFNSEPEQQMEEFLPAITTTSTAEQPISGITNSSSSGIGFVISSVATVDQKFLEDLAQMELQARSPELEEIGPADELPEMSATSAQAGPGSFGNPLTSTTCTLCGKSFSEPFGLRQHMRIMHADTKPFKCPECRKRFAKEQAMLIHLRVHISNRPFMCIVCYKTFTRATALNGHLSSHSHDSLKCFACLEMLPNVQKYAQHIELNHPEFPEVLYRIRAEKPEHERTKLLRRLLLQHQAAPSSIGRKATSHTNQ